MPRYVGLRLLLIRRVCELIAALILLAGVAGLFIWLSVKAYHEDPGTFLAAIITAAIQIAAFKLWRIQIGDD